LPKKLEESKKVDPMAHANIPGLAREGFAGSALEVAGMDGAL